MRYGTSGFEEGVISVSRDDSSRSSLSFWLFPPNSSLFTLSCRPNPALVIVLLFDLTRRTITTISITGLAHRNISLFKTKHFVVLATSQSNWHFYFYILFNHKKISGQESHLDNCPSIADMSILFCSPLSRWRIVTVSFSSVSKSTVMQ